MAPLLELHTPTPVFEARPGLWVKDESAMPNRAVALPDKLGGVVKVQECTRRLLAKPDIRLNVATIGAVDGR